MATSWLLSDLKLEESETTFEFDRGALRFQTCRVLSDSVHNIATSWLLSDLKLEESETTIEFDRGALRFQTCRVLSADARTMACLWLEESETASEFWREQFRVVGVLFVFFVVFFRLCLDSS